MNEFPECICLKASLDVCSVGRMSEMSRYFSTLVHVYSQYARKSTKRHRIIPIITNRRQHKFISHGFNSIGPAVPPEGCLK